MNAALRDHPACCAEALRLRGEHATRAVPSTCSILIAACASALANIDDGRPSFAYAGIYWPTLSRFINELRVGTFNLWEVPGYRIELTPLGGIEDAGFGYKEGVQEAMKSVTNLKTFLLPWE